MLNEKPDPKYSITNKFQLQNPKPVKLKRGQMLISGKLPVDDARVCETFHGYPLQFFRALRF